MTDPRPPHPQPPGNGTGPSDPPFVRAVSETVERKRFCARTDQRQRGPRHVRVDSLADLGVGQDSDPIMGKDSDPLLPPLADDRRGCTSRFDCSSSLEEQRINTTGSACRTAEAVDLVSRRSNEYICLVT